jgi:hypothetical protein
LPIVDCGLRIGSAITGLPIGGRLPIGDWLTIGRLAVDCPIGDQRSAISD